MPIVNIPIKVLGQSHSRSNSSSSPPPPQPPPQQPPQPSPNANMNNFPSRSPIPDFPSFSSFGSDPDWANFPQFPNFPSFPGFARDGGLSPNPSMMQGLRRSPTPQSPTSTLRRHSQSAPRQPQQTTPPTTTSRPPSRTREPKEPEVPERPAVIPLPYEKKPEEEPLAENIAKISISSPVTDRPKRGKKLQRNQSVVDFNAKTIVTLDKIEVQVEQLRKKAAELELEKEQILRALGEISVHNCMFKLEECDREEIEAITERLTKRTKTVQVVVETPRNAEQKKALEDAGIMIDDVSGLMNDNIERAKVCLQTYLNACSYEETAGATCQNFLKIIIQCAADDQKRIKRRLENLMSQIENAERTKADLLEEEEDSE